MPVHAEILNIPMTYMYTGGSTPSGDQPWVDVWLEDTTQAGTVAIRIDLKNLVDGEFLTDLHLSLRPGFSATNLLLSIVDRQGDFLDPQVDLGEDKYKAGGGNYYDILLEFAAKQADRFGADESITFLVSGPADLTARAFDTPPSQGKGKYDPDAPMYVAAAHVQGTGEDGEDSAWITNPGGVITVIPEPATMSLLAIGGVALIKRRR